MKDWERVDISEKDIKDALTIPDNFGMFSYDERYTEIMVDKTWSLGPVVLTRDSGLMAESNYLALMEYLKGFKEIRRDWKITSCSHYGDGWVKHLSFKVYTKKGKITKIFKVLKAWFDALSEYPSMDDNRLSDMVYRATIVNIGDAARNLVKDNLPEGWKEKCYDWLSANEYYETDNENGYYPEKEHMVECLKAMDFYDTELDS